MSQAGSEDPLRALLGFHGRIRAALKSLDDLATAAREGGEVDPLVARALYDFFTGPIVWHDHDEEESLMPRLRRVRHPPRTEVLLERVTETHHAMEAEIGGLMPHLLAVADDVEAPDGERLSAAAHGLRDILEPHLRMEEQEIIPLARLLLTEEDLAAMGREMHERLAKRRAALDPALAPGAG